VFPGAYRTDENLWNKLLSGKIINPKSNISLISNKNLIISGEKDATIKITQLKKYCKKFGIELHPIKNCGHLNIKNVITQPKIYKLIFDFINN